MNPMSQLNQNNKQSLFKVTRPPENNQEACVINTHNTSITELKSFIKRWNSNYPIDRWWRNKYNIPLNSPSHRQAHLVDMRLDWEEDLLYNEIKQQLRDDQQKYVPGRGEWLKKREIDQKFTQDQLDDVFDNLNVSSIEKGDSDNEIII